MIYGDKRFRRGAIDRYGLGSTRNYFVTSACGECFRREWEKFFHESFLVRYINFRDGISRRLGLRMKPLDCRSTECRTRKHGQRYCVPSFHKPLLLVPMIRPGI